MAPHAFQPSRLDYGNGRLHPSRAFSSHFRHLRLRGILRLRLHRDRTARDARPRYCQTLTAIALPPLHPPSRVRGKKHPTPALEGPHTSRQLVLCHGHRRVGGAGAPVPRRAVWEMAPEFEVVPGDVFVQYLAI